MKYMSKYNLVWEVGTSKKDVLLTKVDFNLAMHVKMQTEKNNSHNGVGRLKIKAVI